MEERVLNLLEEICEDDIVREDRNLNLFEEDLLDSLAFTELLVAIEDEFGIVISPSEAVSYTHLDVYKRQLMCRRRFLIES